MALILFLVFGFLNFVTCSSSDSTDSQGAAIRSHSSLLDFKRSVFYGENITILCPIPDVIWYFENASLSSTNVRISGDAIVITMATLSNQGAYSCKHRGMIGDTARIQLQVVGIPPVFGVKPVSTMTYFGISASFRCEVSGLPQPQIYWYFISLSGGTMPAESTISTDHTTLTLNNPKESGTVYCIATNPYGLKDISAVLLVTLPNAIG